MQATLRAPHPAPANDGTPPTLPVTPRLSVPAASVWRPQPLPLSAEPRPRQLQKMAAKAAPVATLPRAGAGAAAHPQPRSLPPPGDSPPGARTLAGTREQGPRRGASGEGEGRLPAGGGGNGVPGGQCMRALTVCPPNPHDPCPHEVMAPGWENANWLLTSVTACRPHPCRYRGPQPTPTPVWELGWPVLTAPAEK